MKFLSCLKQLHQYKNQHEELLKLLDINLIIYCIAVSYTHLLLNKNQIDDIWNLRRLLNDYDNKVSATSALIKAIKTTRNNDELLAHLPKVLYK